MRKRLFDFIIASLVVVVASPAWAIIAAGIRLDSPGPVFHRAMRVGRGGTTFRLFKFRTMHLNAAGAGPGVTRRGDDRITRVGRFLRASKIDEMPQLLNVIRGEMSIVGPRPEDPRYVAHYTDEQRRVLTVLPGMASPTFIEYRHEEHLLAQADDLERTYVHEIMPRKLAMDLEYLDRRSFGYDLRIIGRAAVSLFVRHGAGAAG